MCPVRNVTYVSGRSLKRHVETSYFYQLERSRLEVDWPQNVAY